MLCCCKPIQVAREVEEMEVAGLEMVGTAGCTCRRFRLALLLQTAGVRSWPCLLS